MAKTVKVSIVVDDDGTMRLTERSASRLGTSLNNVGVSARRAERGIKGTAQTASASGKNFGKQASIISGGLVPAYATLAAQVFAVSAAFSFLKDSGNLQLLQSGQEAYFAATGISTRQLTEDIIRATDAQLNFTEAAQAAAIGTAAGLNSDQITRLGRAAADVSQVLGRDLTDSFNRLVRGVTKAEPELLDELGIILRLDDATRKYKESLNISGELTTFQKSQAVTAEVLGQVEEKYGRILEVVGRSSNQFSQLEKVFTDLTKRFKEFAVIATGPIVEILKEYPVLLVAAFTPFLSTVLSAALPGLSTFGDKLSKLSSKASDFADKTRKSAEELQQQVAKAGGTKEYLANLRTRSSSEAQALETSKKLRKNALLQQLRDGKTLSQRQISTLKRQIETEQLLFKKGNVRRKRDFLKTLAEMQAANKASSSAMARDFNVSIASKQASLISFGASGLGVFATLSAAAAGFGTVLTFALSALSWITLIATLAAVAYAFFRAKKETQETKEEIDLLGEKVESAEKELQKFVQVQNILYEGSINASQGVAELAKALGNISQGELFAAFEKISEGPQAGQLKNAKELEDAFVSLAEANKERLEAIREAEDRELKYANAALKVQKTHKDVYDNYIKIMNEASETIRTLKDGTEGYLDILEKSSNKSIAGFASRIKQERQAVQGLTSEFLKSRPATIDYLNAIENFDKGIAGSEEELKRARKAYLDLGKEIDSVTKTTKDNITSTKRFFQGFYPESETQRNLRALELENQSLLDLEKSLGGLDEAQRKRLKNVKELIPVIAQLAEQEKKRAEALDSINLVYTQQLKGATNLQKTELKLQKDIKTKTNEIALAQQNKGNILSTQLKSQIDYVRQLKEEGRSEEFIVQAVLNKNKAAKDGIDAEDRRIAQLTAELDLLQRQTVAAKEIADNAFQSFESNLQKGISDLIKGAEKSFKDFALNVTLGVLNTVADTLAKQLTSSIVNFIKPKGKTIDEKIDDVLKMTTLPKQIHDAIVSAGNHIAQTFGIKTRTTPSGGASQLGPVSEFTSNPLAAGADPLNLQDQLNQQIKQGIVPKKGFFETLFGKKSTGRTLNQEGNDIIVGDAQDRGVRTGGIFSNFISDFSDVFDKNSEGGFLEKLGLAFSSFGEGLVGLFKSLPDLLGGLFKGFGGFFGGIFGAAAGGIMPGGVTGYANGGIVKRPTLGLVGEGKMNEAVVPLPDGKAIPVSMKGAGQNNNVTVNVSMDSQGNSQTDSQSDGQQGANLGKLIAGAVQEELQRQKRPGGILSPYGAA